MKLYNVNKKVDVRSTPVFDLSGERNLQRYDIFSPVTNGYYYKSRQLMDSNFWKPNEVDLSKDVVDFKNLEPHEEKILTLNIKRQEILDSLQGRGPRTTFGRITTSMEFEYWLSALDFQECNHSDTYSYILKNVYDDSTKVFDEILDDEMISRHSINIAEHYEKLYNTINRWETEEHTPELEHELKKDIYLALISWNILEGVRFYVSFACTFAFAENKKMEGNAKELKLIARDENIHLAGTQFLIKKLNKVESEGFVDIAKECKEEVKQMYLRAAEDEIEWCNYLFEDGSIIGLNSVILSNYMKYLVNDRHKSIGGEKLFDEVTANPLPWMDAWLGRGQTEVRPQETEITAYSISNTSHKLEEDDWS